jgi:hypothetical protein
MIEMRISHIPAKDTSDPWEVATAVVDGRKFVARSQSSCEAKLARTLVAAGVPDQPWQSFSATRTPSLRGRSLHRLAGLTVRAEYQAIPIDADDPAAPDEMDLSMSVRAAGPLKVQRAADS